MTPMPTQITGAQFLAARHRALLADEPRVGKTGAAIIAADMVIAKNIDVITTASGRAVWRRGFATWSNLGRTVGIVGVDKNAADCDVRIFSYNGATTFASRRDNDLVILDESHNCKNPEAKRTEAILGKAMAGGARLFNANAFVQNKTQAWFLTGTPLPHDPSDIWTTMRSSCPDRLLANDTRDWPDVTRFEDFRHRYCVVRMKKISNFNKIPVVIGGKNEGELRERLGDFILRRTQRDIGIRPSVFELFPLIVSPTVRKQIDGDLNKTMILDAAKKGDTSLLNMELGPLRRLTGNIKARCVVDAVKDEFASGLDKIVLMYWHREVGDVLQAGLENFKPLRIDGSTPTAEREQFELAFRNNKENRIMLGQIQAAGEAVDFSSANELWFVETSFTPKDQAQAAMRITNVNQTRNTFVRVCCIEGSIDEALQASLLRLWTAINGVIK
jgi:SNF2 family DNA or RNA helicase